MACELPTKRLDQWLVRNLTTPRPNLLTVQWITAEFVLGLQE